MFMPNDPDTKNAEQIKADLAKAIDDLHKAAGHYAALAMNARHAPAGMLLALTGTERGESLEVLITSARLRLATFDASIKLLEEALITRAREIAAGLE
jgi:hypothetical protein